MQFESQGMPLMGATGRGERVKITQYLRTFVAFPVLKSQEVIGHFKDSQCNHPGIHTSRQSPYRMGQLAVDNLLRPTCHGQLNHSLLLATANSMQDNLPWDPLLQDNAKIQFNDLK